MTGLLGSASWNMFSLMVVAISGLITMPIVIRGIGTENYGLYSIIMMIGGFMALQDLGLGEATLRFVAKYYAADDLKGINRVMGATLFVYSVTGTLVSGLIMLLAPLVIGLFKVESGQEDVAILALRIAGLGFLFTTFRGALQKIPEAVQRYDISSKILIGVTVIRCIVMIVVVKMGGGIVGLAWILSANALLNIVIYYFVAIHLIAGIRCFPQAGKEGLKEVFSYGIFSFINQIISNIALYMDRFILGMFFGTADVGYLTAPKDLLTRAQGLTGAAGRALFPRFSSMKEGPEMQQLYCFSLWALTCCSVVIFIPTAIVMPEFLSLWVSPEFAEYSAPVARLLALGLACNGGVGAYFALLKGTGRIHWLTWIFTTYMVISAIITALLVFKYGLIGAGVKMLVAAWCGMTFCMVVGKMVFSSLRVGRVLLETAIIPVSLGGLVYVTGINLQELNLIGGWISLMFFAVVCAALLGVMLLGVNIIIFRKDASGSALIKRITNK